MNATEFCYWLQGFFEVSNPANLTKKQTEMVKEHLGLVFEKVTTGSFIVPKHKAKDALSAAKRTLSGMDFHKHLWKWEKESRKHDKTRRACSSRNDAFCSKHDKVC